MSKEILIYGSVNDSSIESFMNKMEVSADEDIILRINTNGGDPQSSFGAINKFQEHSKGKILRVDGKAYSTGAFFCCYTKEAEGLDVSDFLLHRAAYPSFIENNPDQFTDARRESLAFINSKLREALEAKVDVEKFERITGVTMDQLFSMDGRIDVPLNAEQAEKVGLIDRIIKITPEIQADVARNIESHIKITAESFDNEILFNKEGSESLNSKSQSNKDNLNTSKVMDINTLKAEHPALYLQIAEAESAKGAKQERERIGAYMVFADVDLNAVKDGINAGESITAVEMAEFSRKLASAEYVKDAEIDSAAPVDTTADKSNPDTSSEEVKKAAKVDSFYEEFLRNKDLSKK